MEGLISEIYGNGHRRIDFSLRRNERTRTEAELFLFPLVEEDGDRSIFSRSSLALANSLSSLAPVSFSFCQFK